MSAEVIKRLAALNLFLELRHLNIAPTTLLQRGTIQVTWVRFSRMELLLTVLPTFVAT
jgi:hypothetical protein